mmetsp:Transcript_3216/g.4675  ORF Transcript_3216/g.4675 Transcript_3216/m.4675 type:complete len:105 (-) Transcript_3216:336-650(-)
MRLLKANQGALDARLPDPAPPAGLPARPPPARSSCKAGHPGCRPTPFGSTSSWPTYLFYGACPPATAATSPAHFGRRPGPVSQARFVLRRQPGYLPLLPAHSFC